MKVGEDARPSSRAPALPTGVRLVLIDVFAHPDSSIKEITARTGLRQSHVSVAVAGLREQGASKPAPIPTTAAACSFASAPSTHAASRAPVGLGGWRAAVALDEQDADALTMIVAELGALARRLQRSNRARLHASSRPPINRASREQMTLSSELAFRVGHTIRSNAWLRVLLGALIITVGALELILGLGHGRLIALGALLLAGGATAVRGRLRHPSRVNEPPQGSDDQSR